jgi:MFS transporter, DHA1 family, inner membrane transport protein
MTTTTYVATRRPTLIATPGMALFALALGAFAVGTSEFMISGLLRNVATDLGVSIPSAGLLVTGYASGVAVGGPLMTILTGQLNRKLQIMLLLVVFIAGNLVCAVSPSYSVLLIGRIIGAFCHGAFYGAASVAAGVLVPTRYRARALATVSAGVMVANVIGVPLGTAFGQMVGWRAAFWGVSALGAAAALALLAVLPKNFTTGEFKLLSEIRALLRPQVLLGLSLSLCFTTGLFSCFPYLTSLLTTVSGAQSQQIPLLLMAFGAGATLGVLGGGRLADWRLRTALIVTFCAQIAAYVAIFGFSENLAAMWVVMFAVGAAGMAAVAPLRMLVLNAAFDAPALASTMTSSAFNLGVALGAALGATLLQLGLDYADLPFASIALAASGVALLPLIRATKDTISETN